MTALPRLVRLLLAVAIAAAPAGAQELPDSTYIRQRYAKRELRIPMRDGVRLHTVAYVPRDASASTRYPIVLTRTPFAARPYGDSAYAATVGPDRDMEREGYIFVTQEVRGRYRSEGTFENARPLLPDAARARDPRATDEATDAWDTIAWLLANLERSDGRVALHGVSYGGYYAGLAARSGHPAIRAVSLQAPVADFFFEDFRRNGALLLANYRAYPVFGTPRPAPTSEHWWLPAYARIGAGDEADDFALLLGLGTLRALDARLLGGDAWWRAVVAHPTYDAFWRARALPPALAGITAPVLVMGGWFDAENLHGTLAAYRALRERSPRADVTLAMGPFGHRQWSARDVAHTVHGHLWFGDSLEARLQRDVEAAFFRAHLKGDGRGAPAGAHVFDTGRRAWRRLAGWPVEHAQRRLLYLRADGTLASDAPRAPGAVATYVTDPARPVPSRCTGPTVEDGRLWGHMTDDQRCLAGRADVARFATPVLEEDLTVAGPLSVELTLATTGTDADVVATLVDEYPSDARDHPHRPDTAVHMAGYRQLVRGDVTRARFRRSLAAPLPMRPGAPTRVVVELPDVLHTFRRGHRLVLQVHGTWFPLLERNPGRFVRDPFDAREPDYVRTRVRLMAGSRMVMATLGD